MYGFGGIPKFDDYSFNYVQHCFHLNGNKENAESEELDGIIKTYINSLGHVEKDGPTYFSPLLKHVMNLAQIAKENQ